MNPYTIQLEVEPIGLEVDFDLQPGQCLRVGSSEKMEIPLPDSGLDSYHLSIERRDDGQVYVEFFGEGQIVRGGEGGESPIQMPAKFEAGGLRFFLEGHSMGQSVGALPTEQASQAASHSVPLPAGNGLVSAEKKKIPVLAIVGVALAILLIGGGGIVWWLNSRGGSEQSADNGEATSSPVSAPMTASGGKQTDVIKKEMPPEVSQAESGKKPEKFQPTKESPATVAVLEFENNSGDEENEPLRKGLRDMMTTDLAQIPVLKVVERARLESIMEELKLSEGKFIDPATAVKVGKGLAARAVLSGSYAVVGETMRLDTRLVDVETGEVLMAEQMTGKKVQFFELQQGLVAKLMNGFEVDKEVSSMFAKIEPQTKSFEAFSSYSRGAYALDQGNVELAKTEFQAAASKDTSFALADDALKKIQSEAKKGLANYAERQEEKGRNTAEKLKLQQDRIIAILKDKSRKDGEYFAAQIIMAAHFGMQGKWKEEMEMLLTYWREFMEKVPPSNAIEVYADMRRALSVEAAYLCRVLDPLWTLNKGGIRNSAFQDLRSDAGLILKKPRFTSLPPFFVNPVSVLGANTRGSWAPTWLENWFWIAQKYSPNGTSHLKSGVGRQVEPNSKNAEEFSAESEMVNVEAPNVWVMPALMYQLSYSEANVKPEWFGMVELPNNMQAKLDGSALAVAYSGSIYTRGIKNVSWEFGRMQGDVYGEMGSKMMTNFFAASELGDLPDPIRPIVFSISFEGTEKWYKFHKYDPQTKSVTLFRGPEEVKGATRDPVAFSQFMKTADESNTVTFSMDELDQASLNYKSLRNLRVSSTSEERKERDRLRVLDLLRSTILKEMPKHRPIHELQNRSNSRPIDDPWLLNVIRVQLDTVRYLDRVKNISALPQWKQSLVNAVNVIADITDLRVGNFKHTNIEDQTPTELLLENYIRQWILGLPEKEMNSVIELLRAKAKSEILSEDNKKRLNETLLGIVRFQGIKQNAPKSKGITASPSQTNSNPVTKSATSKSSSQMPPESTVRFGSKRSNTPSASTKKANSPPEHSWDDIKDGLSDGTFQSIGSTGFVFKQGNSETKIGIEELQPEALVNLGLMKAAGDRTPKDATGAFGLFKRAAEMDHPSAAYYLGECLVRGKGTSVQMEAGIIWLKKARALNNGRASDYLGNLYRDGYPGHKPDLFKARELFKEASDRDVLSGHYNYGVVLINGEGGEKDAPAAVYQFQRAADAGYAPAMKALAQCYEHGIGAKADQVIAAKWKAKLKQTESGTESSSSKADQVEKESSPETRKWRSLGGEVIEGRFQRIEASGIVLKAGGGMIRVPMGMLHPEDRKFAEDYLKAHK